MVKIRATCCIVATITLFGVASVLFAPSVVHGDGSGSGADGGAGGGSDPSPDPGTTGQPGNDYGDTGSVGGGGSPSYLICPSGWWQAGTGAVSAAQAAACSWSDCGITSWYDTGGGNYYVAWSGTTYNPLDDVFVDGVEQPYTVVSGQILSLSGYGPGTHTIRFASDPTENPAGGVEGTYCSNYSWDGSCLAGDTAYNHYQCQTTFTIPTPPADVCSNLTGTQTSVPANWFASGGACYPPPADPTATCNANGTVTLSFPNSNTNTAYPGGTRYYLRLDKLSDGWITPGSDTVIDGYNSGSTWTPSITQGTEYRFWVHAGNATGNSWNNPPADISGGWGEVTFNCSAGTLSQPAMTTSCEPDGNYVNLSWSSDPGATAYMARADDPAASCGTYPQYVSGNPNDGCVSGEEYTSGSPGSNTGLSARLRILPNTNYKWWVHAGYAGQWTGLSGYTKVDFMCVPKACIGTDPANATLCSGDSTGLSVDTGKTAVSSCTATKCEYQCNSGYVLSGGQCVPATCTGNNPANSTMCANDASGLTTNVAKSLVPACTATKCEFTCSSGYVYSGGTCRLAACTGTVPSNSYLCGSDDVGLISDTNRTLVGTCTAGTKCEYICSAGYTFDGTSCVVSPTPQCTGLVPSNATLCSGDDTGLSVDTARTAVGACTATKCEYSCNAGYTYSGGSCVVTPPVGDPMTCSASSVTTGGSIQATVSGGTSGTDWVGLYAAGAVSNGSNLGPNGATPGFIYMNDSIRPKTVTFSAPTSVGNYELRLFYNDTYTVADTCAFSVTSGGTTNLSSDYDPLVIGFATKNQTVTFRGRVSNAGTLPVNGAFADNFSYRWGTSGNWIPIGGPIAKSVPFAQGATQQDDSSPGLLLDQSGTLQVQHCVDSGGAIPESNEGDNCRVSTFNVNVITPPTNLTATCNAAGTALTMNWTQAPGQTLYYVRGNYAGTLTQAPGAWNDNVSGSTYTFNTTPGQFYDVWIHTHNFDNTWSDPVAVYNISCVPGQPNLNAVSIGVSPVNNAYTQLNPFNLSGSVTNNSSANAGAFSDNFTYQWNGTGGAWSSPIATIPHASGLSAGATDSTTDVASYSIPSGQSGDIYFQYCVDTVTPPATGQVSESLETASDNCKISGPHRIPPPPPTYSATCNPAGTQITVNWTYPAGYSSMFTRVAQTGNPDTTTMSGQWKIINSGTSDTFNTTPGQNYYVWLHTRYDDTHYSQPVTISNIACAAPQPNLRPTSFTFSGSFTQNVAKQLNGTVQNNSAVNAGAFSDNFTYRYGTSGSWLTFAGNTVSRGSGLGANTTAPTPDQVNFTPPSAGNNLYLQYCVDTVTPPATGQVGESNESDNCMVTGPHTVAAPLQPNLTAVSVTPAAGPYTQDVAFNVTGVVQSNGGANITTPFTDNFTYQWNSTAGTWLSFAGNTDSNASLNNGISTTDGPVSFTPDQSGTLYIQYCIDSTSAISETNETVDDNCEVSAALTVNPPNSPFGFFDNADCSVMTGWVCDADSYPTAVTVNFYDGATLIGSTVANGAREPAVAGNCGGVSTHGFSFTTPASIKNGVPHTINAVGVNVGGTGFDTDLWDSPKSITCAPPQPNLNALSIQTGAVAYTPNSQITIFGTTTNNSSVAAGAFTNRFRYQWNSTTGSWLDFAGNTVSKSSGLAANTTSPQDSVTYTPTIAGTLYFQYCVDSGSAIGESNEGDNCIVTPGIVIPPQPTGVTATCNAAGNQVTVNWTYPVGFSSMFTRIADTNNPDPYAMVSQWKTLYAGQTQDTFTTTPGGNYYVWIHTRFSDYNYSTPVYVYNISCVPPVDLVATNVTSSGGASFAAGQDVSFTGTFGNTGSGSTASGFQNGFSYSRNGASGPFVQFAIQPPAQAVIGPSPASRNETSATVSFSAGPLRIRYCADTGSAVPEGNELNNCFDQDFTVTSAASVTCQANPTSVGINDTVTWSANVTGESGSFTYTWTLQDHGTFLGASSVQRTYATAGNKTGSVTVRRAATGTTVQANVTCSPVTAVNAPSADLKVRKLNTGSFVDASAGSPFVINAGDQIELQWSSQWAASCAGSNFTTGPTSPISGTQQTVTEPLAGQSRTFTAVCGTASDSVVVNTAGPSGAPIINATPNRIDAGDSTLVNGNLNGHTGCVITGGLIDPNNLDGDLNPNTMIVPDTSQNYAYTTGGLGGETTYYLTCSSGGTDQATVRVVPKVIEF